MSKLNYYIILSIAEKAYQLFKQSKFSTYPSFCKKLALGVESSTLTPKEMMYVCDIIDEINLIYGLNDKKVWPYLNVFFKLSVEDYGEYYKYLKTSETLYPMLFIDK